MLTEIMAGRITTDGETFASCMGLKSSSFTVNISSGNVIFTVKGDGAGYGMSMQRQNQSIRRCSVQRNSEYYYKNITITMYKNLNPEKISVYTKLRQNVIHGLHGWR